MNAAVLAHFLDLMFVAKTHPTMTGNVTTFQPKKKLWPSQYKQELICKKCPMSKMRQPSWSRNIFAEFPALAH